ncbi:MAG: hypothetical protein J5891_05010 [Spirochaetales bacterium]|nr:hypothetical protein [Spirochaetales bacterium]
MKKHRIVLAVALTAVALMLAGCSADQLMGTGKALGQLSDAGTGHGGDKYVSQAAESVNGFIETYESLIDWEKWEKDDGTRTVTEGKELVSGELVMKTDEATKLAYVAMRDKMITSIIKASETRSSDASLRAALNTSFRDYDGVKKPYKSKTVDWFGYKGFREVVNGNTWSAAIISMVVPVGAEIEKIYSYSMPFFVQGSDVSMLLRTTMQTVLEKVFKYDFSSLIAVVNKIKKGGGESKFKVEELKYILDNIVKNVGDRKDPTVGDKVAMFMIYDIVDTTCNTLVKYVDQHEEETPETKFDSLNAEWILGNCSVEMDRIFTELQVIGYIYDTNIDVAGISGMLLGE